MDSTCSNDCQDVISFLNAYVSMSNPEKAFSLDELVTAIEKLEDGQVGFFEIYKTNYKDHAFVRKLRNKIQSFAGPLIRTSQGKMNACNHL